MRKTLSYFVGSHPRYTVQRRLQLLLSLTLLALLSGLIAPLQAQAQVTKEMPLGPRISTPLALLYQRYRQDLSVAVRQGAAPALVVPDARFVKARSLQVAGNRVFIKAIAAGSAAKLANSIRALGGTVTGMYKFMVSAYVPVGSLGQMANLTTLNCALPGYKYRLHVGLVTSQGDRAMKTDKVRQNFAVDGTGVKVGVLSDSFDKSGTGSYATDITSGDLPAGVQVVADRRGAQGVGTDEGRAMLQIIHDVAPGSSLAFATGDGGDAGFASNILALQTAGCKVIVDDLSYLDEPFFEDGLVAQAVNTVVANGAVYTSSSGNDARQSYESAFRTGTVRAAGSIPVDSGAIGVTTFRGGTTQNFATSGPVTDMQSFTLGPGDGMRIVFQWEDAYLSANGSRGANQDLDIYVLNAAGTQILEGSADNNIGQDPLEIFEYFNSNNTTTTYNMMIVQHSTGTPPRDIKYINFTDGAPDLGNLQFATKSSTCFGHPNTTGALATGAAYYKQTPVFGQNPPLLEPFSSAGGTPIYRDLAGNAIAPITLQKPNVTAPDGVDTTFFPAGPGNDSDGDGFPNFFGTSAAAPHAGALAALMLQAKPSLPPAAVYDALQTTAIDMGPAGFDFDSGYGLIDGSAALAKIAVPDKVPPTLAITSPVNNSVVAAIPAITGTVFDLRDDGTAGRIAALNIAIIRNSDGAYYNGATFTATPASFPATVNADGTFVLQNVNLPTGTNLTVGAYTIVATATDGSGNTASASVVLTVDNVGPTVTITNPVTNTLVTGISSITGTAVDNAGGSGVASVNVTLRRDVDNTYWNGTAWVAIYTLLPTILNANGSWFVSSPLPSSRLIDSTYTITAIATDTVGNTGTGVVVVAAKSGLSVNFNTPQDGGFTNGFANITGFAQESSSVAGLTAVFITIQRQSDGLYFNAGTWSAIPFDFPTTLNPDGTFSIRTDSVLPTGTNLVGNYILTAIAVDNIGNVASKSITVTLDTVPPIVSFVTPANGLATTHIPDISGLVRDNPGGSGVDRVELELINPAGGYWNGTIYTEAPSSLLAQISSNRWFINSLNNSLPTGRNLPDGRYTLRAIAYDKAGGSASVSQRLIIDNTAPHAPTITAPVNGGVGVRFGTINGRVSDSANGSGIKSVQLYIQRRSDGQYLTVHGLSAAKLAFSTTMSGNGLSFYLAPSQLSAVPLQDDIYTITATAIDKAGNSTTGQTTIVTIDRLPPLLTFTTPALNGVVKNLSVVRGTVDDRSNGTGVKMLNLYLQRRSDGKWWNGTAWVVAKTALTVTRSGIIWLRRGGLPTGKNLLNGAYVLQIQAVDKVGNTATLNSNITVDNAAPTRVSILTPANNAKLTAFTSISGSAADNSRGSGLDRVELTIRRRSDGKYWTGMTWSATRTILATRLSGTSWHYAGTLPTTAGAATGYTLTATAFDRAGNVLSATVEVTVGTVKTKAGAVAASTTPAASRLSLSTASVAAAQSSAQLRFGGALDSDAASDASHYLVTVNGHTVMVESAGYNAVTHTVALALPEGTLHVGDSVIIAWDGLLDAQGALLHSQVGPLSVR